MKYILSGDPKEVAKVIQENRIRVERGLIEFEPVQPETAPVCDSDTDCIETAAMIDVMDDKRIDVEDLHEADLDTDDKTLVVDDTKDVPATDSKETAPAKKSTKRSKKSE